MGRPKKNRIQLSDADVKQLKGIIKKKDTNQTTANRCRILLALDENHLPAMTYVQCVDAYAVSRSTIAALLKLFSEGGIDNWEWYHTAIRNYCDHCSAKNIEELADQDIKNGYYSGYEMKDR